MREEAAIVAGFARMRLLRILARTPPHPADLVPRCTGPVLAEWSLCGCHQALRGWPGPDARTLLAQHRQLPLQQGLVPELHIHGQKSPEEGVIAGGRHPDGPAATCASAKERDETTCTRLGIDIAAAATLSGHLRLVRDEQGLHSRGESMSTGNSSQQGRCYE